MYDLKPHSLLHGRRSISAVKDRLTRYWMVTACGYCTLLFLLATGNVLLPVAVVAAPSTPVGGATFDILWLEGGSCAPPPSEAVAAFDYAAGLWGTWISSTVPISATVCWRPDLYGGDALGTGMPTQYVINFPGAPLVNTHYPIALANALSGSDLNPGRADMALQFKSDANWSYVTTTTHLNNTAATFDFVTVALHELAHGLGFVGNMVVEYSIGFCGNSLSSIYCPTPYDQFAVDSSGVRLLDPSVDPLTLGALLKSDASFSGPNAVAANAGATAQLYTPATWYSGSSLSHLDQTTFEASTNHLMTPIYYSAARHPGPVTLAMMQDIGWLRADGVPNVVMSGPRIVGVGTATPFTGTLFWDGYTGQPITYTWTTTEQITTTHPGLITPDAVTYTWATPGEKAITLTVTDGASPASAVRTMLTFAASVTGPTAGKTGHAYTFSAGVTLDGYPLTYTWEATGKMPVTSGDNSVTYTWSVSGTQTITVTAVIEGAPTQAVHTIAIEETIYCYIYLPLVQRTF